MNQQNQDLYQNLSEKYNLPISKIKKIVEHQFEYTKECIKVGDEILLHNFGTFTLMKHKVYTRLFSLIKNYKNKKIDKDYFLKEFKRFWIIKNKINYGKKRNV